MIFGKSMILYVTVAWPNKLQCFVFDFSCPSFFLSAPSPLGDVTILESDDQPPPAATALLGEATIMVPMAGLIDVSAELARLRKKRDRLDVDLRRSEGKLSNDKFVANAPDDVVTRERQRVEDARGAIAKIEQQMATMASLAGS